MLTKSNPISKHFLRIFEESSDEAKDSFDSGDEGGWAKKAATKKSTVQRKSTVKKQNSPKKNANNSSN